jgi:chromosomal replication initiation ATPase DnaA
MNNAIDDPILGEIQTEIALLENRLAALRASLASLQAAPRPITADPNLVGFLRAITEPFDCTIADLTSRSKKENICWARHTAAYILYVRQKWSTPRIGRLFQRDHAAILNSLARVKDRLSIDQSYAAILRSI